MHEPKLRREQTAAATVGTKYAATYSWRSTEPRDERTVAASSAALSALKYHIATCSSSCYGHWSEHADWGSCRMTPTPTQGRKTQRRYQALLGWNSLPLRNETIQSMTPAEKQDNTARVRTSRPVPFRQPLQDRTAEPKTE